MEVLGIDVGGTGIKSNVVNIESGEFISEKFKIKTPSPATPDAVIDCLKTTVSNFNWQGKKIGIGFPAIVRNGYSLSATNIDKAFIKYPIDEAFSNALDCEVNVVNDADAAGLAEMTIGKGKGVKGLVIFITLGTGIGSGMFYNGVLIPNSELGHLLYKRGVFEKYASNYAREKKKLSWHEWGEVLNVYLNHINRLFSPDLILIGGGVSKNYDLFKQYIQVDGTQVDVSSMKNDAGIVGAAMAVF
ncbi:MAG: ROK family protein [Saprospiraceae bacterium]